MKSCREGVEIFPNDTLAGPDESNTKSFREVPKIFPNDTLAGTIFRRAWKNLSERSKSFRTALHDI